MGVGGALVPDDAVIVERTPCPRLDIPSDPGQIGGSPRFRKHLRSYVRALEKDGVEFSWEAPGSVAPDTLRRLLTLHRMRAGVKGISSSFDERRLGFLSGLTAASDGVSGPAAIVATSGGSAIGILYGFLWGDTFSYYQTGWDPRWARSSLGTALVREAIARASEHGATRFDFLRGGESYKYRFGAKDVFDETWLVPKGLGGRLVAARFRLRGSPPEGRTTLQDAEVPDAAAMAD